MFRPTFTAALIVIGTGIVLLAPAPMQGAHGLGPPCVDLKLIASDAAEGDIFGAHVAVSGDIAVVGAEFDDDGGSAYVFARDQVFVSNKIGGFFGVIHAAE